MTDPDSVPDPSVIELVCYDDDGLWVDTGFTLTYARGVMLDASATFDNLSGAPVLVGWSNTAGGAPTVTQIDDEEGAYEIAFPNAGVSFGHAIATIIEPPPMYCNIQAWWTAAGWEHLTVRCYDPSNGAPNVGILVNVAFVK